MSEPQDIAALREVAEAATPRGWEPRPGKFGSAVASGRTRFGGHYIANNIPTQADAAHIATFDPPTVLALLSEVAEGRALRAAVETLRDEMAGDDCECETTFWSRRLTVLLAAHVPSPLPVGGAAGAGEVGTS